MATVSPKFPEGRILSVYGFRGGTVLYPTRVGVVPGTIMDNDEPGIDVLTIYEENTMRNIIALDREAVIALLEFLHSSTLLNVDKKGE